ncbi:MAG: tRNA (N6-threonylcarbamoyladenosine(37)-N6)-methyltransferase TrmO [Candidatus Aenigmarchaeota archaeon]|nr:tRNA (N6-threonylcarbamoyladenosine(37)-N6)-methyltransferase TrmO [Candidatus Aenigmarchaeota archaeon]
MNLKPIGVVYSEYKKRGDAPRQWEGGISEIEVFKEYEKGLKDVETFSHLHVLYWLHESEGYSLSVNTPWDTKPHGLFAARSPHRPNPIGYSVVKLLGREGNKLRVEGLDAIDGTKVLDIKPYVPRIDSKPEAGSGWLEGKFRC